MAHIYIRFGSKFYRIFFIEKMNFEVFQWVVIVLYLLQIFFCYKRNIMLSLLDNDQTDVIEAFNSTSRYLADLLNIDNHYLDQMVCQIYPTELR